MSLEQDITYTFSAGNASFARTRQIIGSVAGLGDTQILAGTTMTMAFSLFIAKALSIYLTSDQAVTLAAGGANAQKTLTASGTVSGGSFTETTNSQTSAAIAWNSTALQVQAAIALESGVGSSGVVATGGPLPGTPVVLTFVGPLAVQPVTASVATGSITGGGSIVMSNTTTGVAPDTTIALKAGVPLVWDSVAYFAQPFAANVTVLNVINASAAPANFKLRTMSTS